MVKKRSAYESSRPISIALALLLAAGLGVIPASNALENNVDRPGMDYKNFDLASPNPSLCENACNNDPNCKAFTYVRPGYQGASARCWLKKDVPDAVSAECCISGKKTEGSSPAPAGMENNIDRPGMDYKNFDLASPNPNLCEKACAEDPNCKAFTYVRPGYQGQSARCWLKSGVPDTAVPAECCISGKKVGGSSPAPVGMENNIDRPGMDYKDFDLSSPNPNLCEKACADDPNCKAFTYVRPGYQGQSARCWLKSGIPDTAVPAECCISGKKTEVGAPVGMENNIDRPGMDYKDFDLASPNPNLCEKACAEDPNCKAFTYVRPGYQGQSARCWLKSGVPDATSNACCISGKKNEGGSSGDSGLENNIDRPGMDYKDVDLASPNPSLCEKACENDPDCKAFTYVKPGYQGTSARCWLKNGVPDAVPAECCISGQKSENAVPSTGGLENNIDRPGMDYKDVDLASPNPSLCEKACDNDPNCKAFTYVKPGYQGTSARCWLKSGVPDATSNACCISGTK